MDGLRLERVLVSVARKYAPSLIPAAWERAGDYVRLTGRTHADLARGLAAHGALVLFGQVPPYLVTGAGLYLQDWVDSWVRLHAIFCDALFPSYKGVSAWFLDQELPRTALIFSLAPPVSTVIASIAVPFVAHMNGRACPADPILADASASMLARLESDNAARPLRDALIGQSAVLLRLLISAQVYTISPIPYIPGETISERLPDIDDTSPISTYDHETSSLMAVTRQLDTPLPLTLPEPPIALTASAPPSSSESPVERRLPALPIPDVRKKTGELPPAPPIPELPKRK